MKKLAAALFSLISLISLISPALAQGLVPAALSSNVDQNGRPIAGGLLYVYANATTTPQTCYQDLGLTIPMPNPIVADNAGRIPLFYCSAGQVHLRFTTAQGNLIYDYPTVLVSGGAGGGGGGGGPGVDPSTTLSTGDIKFRQTGESLTGWVKLNGTSIGSASSGATQRANADTLALFTYLWVQCSATHCPVSSGRGANAATDFAANKTLTLPDWRDRSPYGLDDMGTTAKGGNPPILSGGSDNATTPGAWGGNFNTTLVQANLPAVAPSGTVNATSNPTASTTFQPTGPVTISGTANNTGTITINGSYKPTGTISISGSYQPGGTVTLPGSVTPTITVSTTGNQVLSQVVNSSTGAGASINVSGSSYKVSDLTINPANFGLSGSSTTINGSSFNPGFTGTLVNSNTFVAAGFVGDTIVNNTFISAGYAGNSIDGGQFSGSLHGDVISPTITVNAGTYSFAGNNLGSGTAFPTASPFVLGTWFMKL